MESRFDYIVHRQWEPEGRKVRTLESRETVVTRAQQLLALERRLEKPGIPDQATDEKVARQMEELAGLEIMDVELIRIIDQALLFNGWAYEGRAWVAKDIAYAILEEPDQLHGIKTII